MKNQKGITLIALVITIIVLLILAGVSIAMLTGDNGILTKATESTTATDLAEVLERVNMELDAQMANALAGDKFDIASKIQTNIGTLPTGYSATAKILNTTASDAVVDDENVTAYNTSYKVQITIDAPDDVTITPTTGGTVSYTGGKWTIDPVEGKLKKIVN